jgi:hypothetical protein
MKRRKVMRRFLSKPVLLAIVLTVTAWLATSGMAFAVTVIQKSLNASVKIVREDADFSFYSDSAATHLITDVSLEDVSAGDDSRFTVYLKNTSNVALTVSAGTNTIPPSLGTLTLTFDGLAQKELAPGAICRVVGTFVASENAPEGDIDFSFSVQAVPAGNTPPPVTTLNGQQLFNNNCLSCHASGPPNTNRTQSQLVSFISGHRTGSGLTQEEAAAIASIFNQ